MKRDNTNSLTTPARLEESEEIERMPQVLLDPSEEEEVDLEGQDLKVLLKLPAPLPLRRPQLNDHKCLIIC